MRALTMLMLLTMAANQPLHAAARMPDEFRPQGDLIYNPDCRRLQYDEFLQLICDGFNK